MMRQLWVLGIMVLMVAQSSAAQDVDLKARYDIYWQGIRVFTSDVTALVSKASYQATAALKVTGLARVFMSGESNVEAYGDIGPDGQIAAREWKVQGRWDGEESRRHLTFDPKGQVSKMEVHVPKSWEDYPIAPIPKALQKGPDPMALFLIGLRRPWQRADLTEPFSQAIIDGRAVTHYQMTCEAEAAPFDTKDSRLAAEAIGIACLLTSKRLAGFIDDSKLTDKQRKKLEKARKKAAKEKAKAAKKDQKDDGIKIWFRYFPDQQVWLPLYAEVYSVKVYLADLTSPTPDIKK